MNYINLLPQLNKLKIFSPQDIYLIDPNFRQATLYDWENQGKVQKIRNGWYTLGGFQPEGLDYYLIANRIYQPSYISLDSALSHYGIIPEGVVQITSVSTNKTQSFQTPFGSFAYRSIKETLYFGYDIIEYGEIGLRMASPEKALLDTIYLNPDINNKEDFQAWRFNTVVLAELLDEEKLLKYATIFNNKRLLRATKLLIEHIHENA